MNVDFINPFIIATTNVLKEIIPDIEMTRGTLGKQKNPIVTRGCASLIGVTGDVEGRVVLDMDQQTAINLAGGMLSEKLDHFDNLVSSTINEIANMICGGAISILINAGKNLDISAPTMFTGRNLEIYDSAKVGEALVVPIESNYGQIIINVAMMPN
ncbi:MAG: chemotaxis protein CheX [Candidatus Margulisbacteria bacterium]|nr:chemotaxis protein CheX [Candidatus Margulisiibacteriota bacterium]